jgi:hypothetical protein
VSERKCSRCGHIWQPRPSRAPDGPKNCPHCMRKLPAQPAPDWRDTACENIERALARAPREFEPTYTLTLGTGEHKTVVELSAYARVVEERDRLRAVLERIATTRCAWPLSQEIAREALKRD